MNIILIFQWVYYTRDAFLFLVYTYLSLPAQSVAQCAEQLCMPTNMVY